MVEAGSGGIGLGGRARLAVAAFALALASGCATTNGSDPRDPIESFNRAMYGFNETLDDAIAKPVATAYRTVLPDFVRTGVRNFFGNIDDLFIGVNNLLQGKPIEAVSDLGRLVVNTTFGVLGLIDVGSHMGLEKHNEDFGQTFGRWGVGTGAYIVWPVFGSSTVRDSVGQLVDWHFDPVLHHRPVDVRNVMTVTRAIGRRADLLDASRVLEEAALDKYVFQRDAYLQRRRSLVHDGNPPREDRSRHEHGEPKAESAPEPAAAGNSGDSVPAEAATTPAADAEPPAGKEAALDKYVLQRDGYLQRRRSLVHDGNLPRAADGEQPVQTR